MSRKRKEIFVDRNFGEREKEKSFRALCIHEVVERFYLKNMVSILIMKLMLLQQKKKENTLKVLKAIGEAMN